MNKIKKKKTWSTEHVPYCEIDIICAEFDQFADS